MLKLTWTPGAAVIPDEPQFSSVHDALMAEYPNLPNRSVQVPRVGNVGFPFGDIEALLRPWLTGRDPDNRLTLMVHGFEFDPLSRGDTPFGTVYGVPAPPALPPARNPVPGRPDPHLSWLPIVGETTEHGGPGPRADCCIAFAWTSEGSFLQSADAGWPSIPGKLSYLYPAFDLAPLAARSLAAVIASLFNLGQKFDILAHSLGTRTVSQAIGLLRGTSFHLNWKQTYLRRLILLDGAEYVVDARANLLGLDFETFNFVDSRDFVVTYLAQNFSAPVRPIGSDSARVIGAVGLAGGAGWLNVQLADAAPVTLTGEPRATTLTGIASGSETALHPEAMFNHWVCYMADTNRAFLTRLLDEDQGNFKDIASLTKAGLPAFAGYAPSDHTVPATPCTRAARIAMCSQGDRVLG